MKRDWRKEAEKLFREVHSLYNRYCRIRLKLITKAVRNSDKIRLVPRSKALEADKLKKKIDKLDPDHLVRGFINIPFEELSLLDLVRPENIKKARKSLDNLRKNRCIAVIEIALKSGWLKPLK